MGKKILKVLLVMALIISLPVFSYADLPSGYTELEYIQSSGTQYIDTGFFPTVNTTVNLDFQFSSTPTSQNNLFGVRGSTSDSSKRFYSYYSSNTNRFVFYYGSGNVNTGSDITNFTIPFSFSLDKNGFIVNDYSYPISGSFSPSANSLYLFSYNYNGDVGSSFGSFKLFSSSIEDNGTLVRDFIPCSNASGVIGLWDDVNDIFYTNEGTGDFIAGPVAVPPVPEYSISVSDDGNGSASSDLSVATAGTTVTLSASPNDGYEFSEWQVLQGDIDIVNNQFIMPSSDVSVKAVFVPDGYYSVTVENDGFGTGSANPVRAEQGTRVTLTAVPVLGYEFDSWEVVSGAVNISNNQFIMPASDVVVRAKFKPIVYTITLNQGSNGSATVSQNMAIVGDVITLTATPDDLYSFSFWDVSQGGITVENNQFVMPASNVVITPVFTKQAAISSGYEFHSGVKEDSDITARLAGDSISFGEQPAGEYLINIYSYGQNYGVSFDIGVGSDTTASRKLPYTQSGGITSAFYTHAGGEMVIDLNFTYYKSVLNSPAYTLNVITGSWYEGTGSLTNTLTHPITSSGNWIFNIIDVVAIPVDLANAEDYGTYASLIAFLRDKFGDLISVFGSEESEEAVNEAADELNKEVEDLNNLSGQLDEQKNDLEQQFNSDFKISDELSGQTDNIQLIYTGLFDALGLFSIFIWLPILFAVIKKLLRL